MKILKRFDAIPGWPWRVYSDHEGYGVMHKCDTGWYDFPDIFDSIDDAVKFAKKWAHQSQLDCDDV